MTVIIGPIVVNGAAYAFATWTPETGLRAGYPYHRIEDASYARKAMLRQECPDNGLTAIACATLDAFEAEIAGLSELRVETRPMTNRFLQQAAAMALTRSASAPIRMATAC
jgi:hypothetical protein